ncbi:MAG: TonB family protein [Thermodesulfovibrionales bacterium]
MPGIRDNFFISILLHSLMVAAAFIAGSSSELKVKRLIEVSLIEEWKTGVQAPGLKASLKQQRTKITSVKEAASKPRSEIIPHDNSGRKETVVPDPEAEIKPSPMAVSKAATKAFSADNLSGRAGDGPDTSSAGPGTGFAAQGKASENASAISDITGSRPKQGPSGDTSLQKIRDAIESNLVYPYIARKKKIEGTALVEFRINQRGVPEDFKIVRSSGHSILDKAARETVVKASPFPVLKDTIEIPITFLLKDNRQ